MNQASLPDSPEEITPAWLTTVFRDNRILTKQSVVDVQIDCIGQDRGFTGVVARVQLRYSGYEEAAPASVVVKLPMAQRDTPSAYRLTQEKDMVVARRYFERCAREVLFYQQLAPLIPTSVPRFYYGVADETADRVVLILEDLHFARLGDALHGCSLQDAGLVIDQLAHFHARWWDSSDLNKFSWLPQWGGDSLVAQKRYVQLVDPFLQRFGTRVPKRIRKTIDALTTNYRAVRERLQQIPETMVHGDLHLDNLLFSPLVLEPGVTVIDWQSVSRGRGVIDLALFLFGSLETATRRTVEGNLLRRYHESLLARGVVGYDFLQLLEDCRLVLLWLLGAKVVYLGSIDLASLSGREQALVESSLTEDSFAALFDYDVDTLLPLSLAFL